MLPVMGLSLVLVPAVVNLPLMLAFALVYGAAEGLYVDLLPLTTLRLMGPRGTAEIAWTLLIGMIGIPWIVGPFVAGTESELSRRHRRPAARCNRWIADSALVTPIQTPTRYPSLSRIVLSDLLL